ncbi:MAG: Holliday junction branch migration protein RuvA [Acidocella sp. 20-57-95]|nr:MAG: Holliday junction branch migration protein RuvA [Acidocella sp. 20-57-95]OYV58087.1 MAG: Holliday junction branch migration protein RuvA [Acidocella sp. 21-58-7]HQT64637.1 Holliday junction branch migration protein RuvA [Acidocella sp.]HQU05157.1 Holliday junction branch migration protein RuvA [Acidocella sp.]
MIAKLRGVIDAIEDGKCIIDVNGVGYLVFCSGRTLAALPNPPAIASLLIETQVREDAISLYGFSNSAERDWFRLLTTVQGVGAKVALGLLSALSPDQLIAAIATGDRAALTKSPGVGPKLAVRLLSELREKAVAMPGGGGAGIVFSASLPAASNAADALSALQNLGYRRAEAEAALARSVAELGDDAPLDVLIRAGLKALAK